VDRRAQLLEWLEGEGERQRRKAPAPPELGYAAWRGRAHLGACALWGALAAPLLVCSLAEAWLVAARGGSAPPLPGLWSVRPGVGMTLADVRVEGIGRGAPANDGPAPLTLTVRHGGLLIPCEFRGAKVPRGVQVRDVVTVRSAGWRAEGETEPVLLRDCELVEP
jgi:hypothetical protein